MKHVTLFLLNCLISHLAWSQNSTQLPEVCCGEIVREHNFKSKYISARNIDVWLPEGYSAEQKYAVVYMHDGQMLYDANSTWNKQEWGVDETMSALMKKGTIQPCIVVGVFNSSTTRHPDYFPQKPFESLAKEVKDSLLNKAQRHGQASLFSVNVQSDNYLKFLVEELKPFIDGKYSTRTDRENTFVMGSSMGGLISMYAICEYPEVFGGAACLSTHWPGTFTNENNPIPAAFFSYMKGHLPSPGTHKIYFDFGTATLDAMYEEHQTKVDEIMKAKGFTSKNWMTRKFEGENHSENAWKKRLHIPVKFLLNKVQ
ncbi:alpha/beta hydrolase [Prolixibacteraceae bacterium JC049]|nr:alpha/beta hydrolase [Prolixibacteraceae bacterium JC049]